VALHTLCKYQHAQNQSEGTRHGEHQARKNIHEKQVVENVERCHAWRSVALALLLLAMLRHTGHGTRSS
jgi:hypothetical protein